MIKLEDIQTKQTIRGLIAGEDLEVVYPDLNADTLTLYVKKHDGSIFSMVITRDSEKSLSLVHREEMSFDADPKEFKLAIEAKRIEWAYLFDPRMAVNSSTVTPLPHQITAVYESMLPKQPLRFLLADDPGAGKTVMAGLLILELSMRADTKRVLIVAPGSLVDQWQDELLSKFSLRFEIFSQEKARGTSSGNPFEESPCWIARVDQLSRNEDYQKLVSDIDWDLIVVDEAHKLAAHYNGQKVQKTKRFKLGEVLGDHTRHFLLMTATPHNGKEEDFQLFLSLLDADRFYGKGKLKLSEDDLNDIMRRMVKEEMKKFDGTNLFPPRVAETVDFTLSTKEQKLYENVTRYVREEMNRAEKIADKSKKNVVGFSLTMLQRRLASSPEAIYQSLKRRHAKLQTTLAEAKKKGRLSQDLPDSLIDLIDMDDDDMPGKDLENIDSVVQQATAAQTIAELEAEIFSVNELERLAHSVVCSGSDCKWKRLSELLQAEEILRDRKLIIFTEHRDTLCYLQKNISSYAGNPDAVRVIHGGVDRSERLRIQEEFRHNTSVRFLIATDAAGEGVNLQNTNLMINYDLPWNPNRIEQRFGRIHRIGQTETCHLWNLVAKGTREGDVFKRLFDKLKIQNDTLNGRVFDVLGEVFDNVSLKDLLLQSIMEDSEAKQNHVIEQVDNAFEKAHIEALLNKNALCQTAFSDERLIKVKHEMDEAEARRLQPCYVQDFFLNAMKYLNCNVPAREGGRFQIRRVPECIREKDVFARDGHRIRLPIVKSYDRICFDKNSIRVPSCPLQAEFLHPGHPLLLATNSVIQEKLSQKIANGAILFDQLDDESDEPKYLALVENSVRESSGDQAYAARTLNFYYVSADGKVTKAGPAPHLDLVELTDEDRNLVKDDIADFCHARMAKESLYSQANIDGKILFDQTLLDRRESIDRTIEQIRIRLERAIHHLDRSLSDLRQKHEKAERPGDDGRIAKMKREIYELRDRKNTRLQKLESQKQLYQVTPRVHGWALVIPQGLVLKNKGTAISAVDIASRRRIEKIAMDAVTLEEEALGNTVRDVSKENKGWDIESTPPSVDGRPSETRFIEVKGRSVDNDSKVTVSKNEVIKGFNLRTKEYFLAVVLVDGTKYCTPQYIRTPFEQGPGMFETERKLDLEELLAQAKTAGEA